MVYPDNRFAICENNYDTIGEFNVNWKAECDQLILVHETKTNNASAYLVQYRLKIHEGSPGVIEDYGGKDLCWERDEF